MARNRNERIVIWPLYFDSSITRSRGRRVPSQLAVHSPKVEDIFSVSKKLGLSPEIQDEKAHPRTGTSDKGRVLVKRSNSKERIINDIAKGLLKIKR